MIKKLIKQNKITLIVLFLLSLFFALVIYNTGMYVYRNELQKMQSSTQDKLLNASSVIQLNFSNIENDLFFIRNLDSLQQFINSNFKSQSAKRQLEALLLNFMKNNKMYFKIRIINRDGREIVRVSNYQKRESLVESPSKLQDKHDRYYFKDAMKLHQGAVFESAIDLDQENGKVVIPYTPVIRVATPFLDAHGQKKGVIVISYYFSYILHQLPRAVFVVTPENNLISLDSDEAVHFNQSHYHFDHGFGVLRLVKSEMLFYREVHFLSGKSLYVVTEKNEALMKVALFNIVWVSVISFAFFIFLILIVVFRNFSNVDALFKTQKAIIYSLVGLAGSRDPETGEHLERTRYYARALAKALRDNKKYRAIITEDYLEDIFDAAPLHDIGKVGIADKILLKEGKLTEQEFEEMKHHVRIGEESLKEIINKLGRRTFLDMAKNISGYHHERFDGTGYVHGFEKDEIPLEARIFSLCDVYDALRSARYYKEKISHEKVMDMLKEGRGTQFDPDVVDAFLKIEKEFNKIYKSFL